MANPLKMLKLKPTGFQFIQEVKIDAPPAKAWKTVLDVGHWWQFAAPGTKTYLEPRAGGRFYAIGKDATESLYATVTLIEPGKLLRLGGPMGMSHVPAQSVFIFELQPRGKGTLLRFCQRTYGLLTPKVKESYQGGWKELFAGLKRLAEKGR